MALTMLTRDDVLALYATGPEAVVALIEQMQGALVVLNARVQELEARLAKDSHNSSKPPSSDGLARKPKSLRPAKGQSGRNSGGQPGHPGRNLRWVPQPDQVIFHGPTACSGCGAEFSEAPDGSLPDGSLDEAACGVSPRQVHDLPPQRLLVTEHRALCRVCPHCRKINQGTFPDTVPQSVQYGPRLQALCVYLQQYQLLPLARTQQLLGDLFDCSLSQGTLFTMVKRCHERLEAVEIAIHNALIAAPVAHFDETGLRQEGRLHWLHSSSTRFLTHYASHAKRGRVALDTHALLPNFKGIAVHDAFVSYFGYSACSHALCNAHLLRELIALHEAGQEWAGDMAALLREIHHAVKSAQAANHARLTPKRERAFTLRYQMLVERGLAVNPLPAPSGKRGRTPQSAARNLLNRLKRYQSEVLKFLTNFAVPFDNNLAERDLRMIKVRQKVSGCFRSANGTAMFCRIRGYISTLRKQGCALLHALQSLFEGNTFWPPTLA